MSIEQIWRNWGKAPAFSGVFSVRTEQSILFEKCCGYRNRSEKLPNKRDTAFAIASGTKLLTALAVCRLIDWGKLDLQAEIGHILPYDLGKIDPQITVFQLLTHTSGMGDYIDEESQDVDFQLSNLYRAYTVYLWENLQYYLQMITPLPAKFRPGQRCAYSNAGFVLLGLVIEEVAGKRYQEYVQTELLQFLHLKHSGFYRSDALPANTALGYIEGNEPSGWRLNVFSLPVVGGADGGFYTCADDLDTLWRALTDGDILSQDMHSEFFRPQIARGPEKSFGLGVYRYDRGDNTVFYALGGDAGVDFFTAYFPKYGITASALGNTEIDTYPLLAELISLYDH